MTDYTIKRLPMKSAQGEAATNVYHMKRVGSRVWLWSNNENAGDNIYVGSDDPAKREDGFGGSTLTFELVDGSSIKLHGPWQTNSKALKNATGVDLTSRHLTYVVIGTGREYSKSNWMGTITNVIYSDDDWCVSEFDRGENLAQEFANELGKTVYCYQQSSGGSSCSPIDPEENLNA